jgi:hypothetical protein
MQKLYIVALHNDRFMHSNVTRRQNSAGRMCSINLVTVTEMSTRSIKIIMFLGSKVWLVHRADSITAIYEPIV